MFSIDVTVKSQNPPADVTEVRDLAEVLNEVRVDACALGGDYLAETEVPHGGE